MHKLEFTLKQHTPLIHFQHDQEGATLRATEVKPKLDRFIIEKLLKEQRIPFGYFETTVGGHQNFVNAHEAYKRKAQEPENEEQKKWATWLLGKGKNEHVALDYKLKIYADSAIQKFIIASRLSKNQSTLLGKKGYEVISPSPYFAQEKEIAALFKKINPNDRKSDFTYIEDFDTKISQFSKIGILARNNICWAVSQNDGILEFIEKYCCEFFVAENFSTRNGKGFGSFTVESINGKKVQVNSLKYLTNNFDFVYSKAGGTTLSDTFSIILSDYKLMKAGHGRQEGYAKSILFQYFAKNNIRWEKRWLKQQIKPLTPSGYLFDGFSLLQDINSGDPVDINFDQGWNDKNLKDNQGKVIIADYMYVRALLGLAESFDFQTNDKNKKIHVKLVSDGALERFKSPVFFKIIENKIYLVGIDQIPTHYLHDNSPTFEIYKKVNEKILKDTKTILSNPIKIPLEFSLTDFVEFSLESESIDQSARIPGYKNEKNKHYE